MTQKEVKGFKLVKLKTSTVKELDKLILKIEKKQPYLKGVVSYNAIVLLLNGKRKVQLSKHNYIKVVK